jgi:Tol biopolymer transport system component
MAIAEPFLGNLDLAVAAFARTRAAHRRHRLRRLRGVPPDSATIAYSSDRSGALEIFEGTRGRLAADVAHAGPGHQAIQPAWSPDGRLIACAELAGSGIWIVPSRRARRARSPSSARTRRGPRRPPHLPSSRPPADLNTGGSFGADSTIWLVEVDGRTPPAPLTAPAARSDRTAFRQWMPGTGRVLFAVATAGVFLGAALWTADPTRRTCT